MSLHYSQSNGNPFTQPFLELEGHGKLSITPNLAVINVGIMTENQNVIIASQENAIRSNKVLDVLREFNIPKDDIETISYTIQPLYDFSEGNTLLKGFKVIQLFEVTVKNISLIGKIYDAVVKAGANFTDLLDFRLSNKEYYYQQALQLAIKNAQEKALKIAQGLGVSLNIVPVKITENNRSVIPFQKESFALQSTLNTAIQKRQVEIEAKISAIFHYS
ncbi:SIMPL domain-containing protein [Litchfieldia salsa]|uniref:DUF541 domain-containing protein n=1 Tax=Litchfieldia salsa TaxID=930152 RepID=A0A1H0TAK6_9BACI|nr:SIMPL domain-containing protein [Litchfieldia salsa]SDP51034.1 hypothetical protein SAMN05216565_103381 [Litchfieldia salsa]